MKKISLRAARVDADLTQEEAEAKTGISRAAIQNYETGKTSPTMEKLALLCSAYGFSTDDIRLR